MWPKPVLKDLDAWLRTIFLALECVGLEGGGRAGIQWVSFLIHWNCPLLTCPCLQPSFYWKNSLLLKVKELLKVFRCQGIRQPTCILGGSVYPQEKQFQIKLIEQGVLPAWCWFSEHKWASVCVFIRNGVLKIRGNFLIFLVPLEKRGPN